MVKYTGIGLVTGERGTFMKCKFCFAEIEQDVTVCPVCGKDLTEQPEEITAEEAVVAEAAEELSAEEAPVAEKKKGKGWKIALAVTGLVVLALVLTGVVLHFMGLSQTVLRTVGIGVENDIFRKLSYTVSDTKAENKSDVVVATVGDMTLTNGELQAHYWMSVYDFLEYYGYYLSYIGIDTNKSFDEQIQNQETGMTYQQWFLENALESWRRYATLVQLSKEAGYTLSESQQESIDALPENLKSLASEYGYTDLEAFIDKEFFPGCSLDAYVSYNNISYQAMCYYDTLYESFLPTQDEIDAYYAAHEAEFIENKLSKEDGDYYNVRHILIPVEGGTEADDGSIVYSDADWEACRAKAQKMLDDFLAGDATESAFAELATNNSADPGSASNGGMYENLTKGEAFIEGFKNWYLEEGRKKGDTGLVKNTESSTQGYHIMYFSGNKPIWEQETKTAILSERTSNFLEEAEAKWPMEVNYNKIVLGYIDLNQEKAS